MFCTRSPGVGEPVALIVYHSPHPHRSCRERLALHNARRKDRLEGRSEPGSDPPSDAADSSGGGISIDGDAGDVEGGAGFATPPGDGKRRRFPAVHKLDMDYCSSEAARVRPATQANC